MGLDNSTIQHPLPGDLQSRVENALDLVTSLETEHARLIKLVGVKTGELQNIHNEYKEIESKIKDANDILTKLRSTITSQNEKLDKVTHSVGDANHELEEAQRQKTEILNEVKEAQAALDKREVYIAQVEAELINRVKDHTDKEVKHNAKVKRLLEALT